MSFPLHWGLTLKSFGTFSLQLPDWALSPEVHTPWALISTHVQTCSLWFSKAQYCAGHPQSY